MQEQTPRIDPDLPPTQDRHGTAIAVGARVRAFDFDSRDLAGDRASYIEGDVIGVLRRPGEYSRYAIRVVHQLAGGEVVRDIPVRTSERALRFAPLNGTRRSLGGFTDGVEVLAPATIKPPLRPFGQDYWKRVDASRHGQTGGECCLCGRPIRGKAKFHVAIDLGSCHLYPASFSLERLDSGHGDYSVERVGSHCAKQLKPLGVLHAGLDHGRAGR